MWEQQSGDRSSRRRAARWFNLVVVSAAVALAGCPAPPKMANAPTLFDRIGQIDGLRPVVDELVWRLAADELIAPSLASANFEILKKQMLLFLCARSGGPCLEGGDTPLIALDADADPKRLLERLLELTSAAARARDISEEDSALLSKLIADDAGSIMGPPR